MFTRDNLPPKVALILAAFQIEREELTDRFLWECNQTPIDGLGILNELRHIAPLNRELDTPRAKLEILMTLNPR